MKTFRGVIATLCLFMLASLVLAQSEEETVTFTYRDGRNIWVWDVWSVLGNGSWPEFRAAVLELNPEIVARGFENLPPGTEIEMPLALLDIRVNGTEALLGDLALVPLEDLEGLRGTVEIQGFAIQAQSDRIEALSAEVASLEATNARLTSTTEPPFSDPVERFILALLVALALLFLILWFSERGRVDREIAESEEEHEGDLNRLAQEQGKEIASYETIDESLLASDREKLEYSLSEIVRLEGELRETQDKLVQKAQEVVDLRAGLKRAEDEKQRLIRLHKRQMLLKKNDLANCESALERTRDEALKESSEVGTRSRHGSTRGGGRRRTKSFRDSD